MIGQEVSMPVAIAPTGLTGMQHADGEILGARAAKAFGIPFTLSTMSICSLEDIAEATGRHPFWFQLYVMRDRDFIERLIERAQCRQRVGAAAHAGPADPRPAAQGHQERPHGAAQAHDQEPDEPRDQAALVHGHAGHEAPHLRQHRGPCQGREGPVLALVMDGRAVRPDAELGRRRVDQEALGRQADPQGRSWMSKTHASRRPAVPMR